MNAVQALAELEEFGAYDSPQKQLWRMNHDNVMVRMEHPTSRSFDKDSQGEPVGRGRPRVVEVRASRVDHYVAKGFVPLDDSGEVGPRLKADDFHDALSQSESAGGSF